MRTIVVYPGRFHPFHRGHKASYDALTKQFGEGNVFIVSSDKQAPLTSPFSFADKMAMMTRLGIPAGRIAQVKNPYQAHEITREIDNPDDTVLIFAVSEKDMQPASAENPDGPRFKFGTKKNGEASYMQPLPADIKKAKPMTQHAYVVVTPTVNFQVRGADANSASEIRKRYIAGNEADREQIIADLYGDMDATIKDIFDRKLGQTDRVRDIVKEARTKNPARALKLLETIKKLEREAHGLNEFIDITGRYTGSTPPPPVRGNNKKDPFGDDPRSQMVRKIQQLLDAGKSVFVSIPGARGRAVSTRIGDDYSYLYVRFRDFLKPTSRTRSILTVPLNTDNDEDLILSAGPRDRFIQTTGQPFDYILTARPSLEIDNSDFFLEENPDYIEEKWSEKYKRSINCNNPRGFSQRAHCAGRKKK